MISLLAAAVLFDFVCGTSPELDRQAAELSRFVAAKNRSRVETMAQRPSRVVNEFLVVPADETTAPFDDPADLEGRSLLFQRRDAETFAASRTSLVYDSEVGELFFSFGRGDTLKELPLTGFAFPFGDQSYSTLWLSVTRGIHFQETRALPTQNFPALSMLTSSVPLISPLYDYIGSPAGRPDVYVKQNSLAVTITWRAQRTGSVDYDIQAVLFRDGTIRFAYRVLRQIAWGGVLVTTGRVEPWLARKTVVAGFDDSTSDVGTSLGEAGKMLDVSRVDIARIDRSSMLEVRLKVGAPIQGTAAADVGTLSYIFYLDDPMNRIEVLVDADGVRYLIPRLGELRNSSAVRIEGSTLVMLIDEDLLALPKRTTRAWVFTGARFPADVMEFTVDLGPVAESAETDFSSIQAHELSRPAVETFSLPTVNLPGVWRRLQNELGFRNDEFEAVFVYTPFLSDIITRPFGAFALYANHGADGVAPHAGKSIPKSPTLVNMNHLEAFANYGTQILLHEMGHRWLYYFSIMEAGERRNSINPLGNHPAQYVHAPAAFNVVTNSDSSVMGGATFTDLGGGRFRSPGPGDWYSGFSWHELYLMGLARPEEVTPWWYIRDADPLLGPEYYPPFDTMVTGTRVDVSVQQIIAAMGPRDPGFATSQKEFRTLFVVLEREGELLTPTQLDPQFRLRFQDAFARATGGRGKVTTTVGPPPSKRRAVRRSER